MGWLPGDTAKWDRSLIISQVSLGLMDIENNWLEKQLRELLSWRLILRSEVFGHLGRARSLIIVSRTLTLTSTQPKLVKQFLKICLEEKKRINNYCALMTPFVEPNNLMDFVKRISIAHKRLADDWLALDIRRLQNVIVTG